MSSIQQEKAQQRRTKFAALLRDMFQLDQPELDFGLYRIMHAKKDDINRFIDEDLPKLAQDAFKDFAGQDKAELEKAIREARQAATAAGFSPDESPKVKELEAQYNAGFDTAREEGEVYDALVTFFNRYYDEGDFISRRVYKDGTYAIPYQGEEVVLHWANKDQYYIKSSETLRDYTLLLNSQAAEGEDRLRVHFKLVDATEGAKDNNKETDDSKRQFVLCADAPFEFIQGEPDAQGNRFEELVCRFEFRPATMTDWEDSVKENATAAAKKTTPTQAHLIDIAEVLLLGSASELPNPWKAALQKTYVKADGEAADYSTLKGQLNKYIKAGQFDYFIHKDLGGFLTRELDFYIKNELMQWEDIAALKNNPARLAPMLSKLDVIRDLGGKIIAFLAQLEDFQKKLWLKKKFVTETNYCITLDRVPEELYPAICANPAQHDEWVELFAIDEIKADLATTAYSNPLTEDFLKANQSLVLDTRFFDEAFKAELIASIEDFDEQCDGLLISSENFQALNFIDARYRKSIDGIYIDPPYNSDGMEIIYKNNYKDSSWCSLLHNRLSIAKSLLTDLAITCTTIDEAEVSNLDMLLKKTFNNYTVRPVVIEYNHRGRVKSNFAITHEYALWTIPKGKDLVTRQKEISNAIRRNLRRTGTDSRRIDSPNQFYGIEVDNQSLEIINITPPLAVSESIPLNSNTDTTVVWPIDDYGVERRWYYGRERVITETPEGTVWATKIKGKIQIHYHQNGKPKMRKSVWTGKKLDASTYGSELLNSIFGLGKVEFSFPKSIHAVEQCIESLSDSKKALFLDYFSGSGTTGHAVINLNREDGGKRKYILVEMGSYFDAVTKPRIAKVAYSSEWRNGKPVSRDTGISHCFKYIRLESYEDTLGNLRLNTKQDLFSQSSDDEARQAYVMNYMLDVETRGSQSLLNIQQFLDPTQYQLNVRSASGDETVLVKVDLLETFNYLLGLEVEHIAAPIYFDADFSQGEFGRMQAKVKHNIKGKWWFRTVYGKNRNGQSVLVVWRNLPSVIEAGNNADAREQALLQDNAVLDAVLVERLKIRLTESVDDEIDVLYVNGDHNIHIPRDRQGQPMEQARVQLIEEAFKALMFADTDAVH